MQFWKNMIIFVVIVYHFSFSTISAVGTFLKLDHENNNDSKSATIVDEDDNLD